jgi:hypothetical protein
MMPTHKNAIISHSKQISVVFISRALPMAQPAVSPRPFKLRLKGRKKRKERREKVIRDGRYATINGCPCNTTIKDQAPQTNPFTFEFPIHSCTVHYEPTNRHPYRHTHTHTLSLSCPSPSHPKDMTPTDSNIIISHIKEVSVVFFSRAWPMAHPAVSPRALP